MHEWWTGGGAGTTPATTSATAGTTPGSRCGGMDVKDDFFDPSSITVTRGATVTWTWRGSISHNVTFEDGQGSSATQSSGTHDRTFGTTGTVRYRCTIHSSNFTSGMVGSVVVQ